MRGPVDPVESDITANDLRRYGFTGFERWVSPFDDGEGGNLFKIQFAWKDKKVALEVDGPTQFFSPSQDLDGRIKARTRLLEKLGWKVLRWSYRDDIQYEGLGDDKRRAAWLKAFEDVGVTLERR